MLDFPRFGAIIVSNKALKEKQYALRVSRTERDACESRLRASGGNRAEDRSRVTPIRSGDSVIVSMKRAHRQMGQIGWNREVYSSLLIRKCRQGFFVFTDLAEIPCKKNDEYENPDDAHITVTTKGELT